MPDALAPRPSHVPASRVIDFDIYNPPGAGQDFHRAWKALQDSGVPDMVWTPRNGGHWMPMRGRIVSAMFADYEAFSSKVLIVPKEVGQDFTSIPSGLDRPEHPHYRMLLSGSLGPKPINRMEERIRAMATRQIETFLAAGRCEFNSDYAEVLPIQIFLEMAHLPLADADHLRRLTERINRPQDDMPVLDALHALHDYLRGPIAERLGKPGDDLFSRIINGQVDGRPLNLEEAVILATTILEGGLDNVTSILAFMMLHLAGDTKLRHELAADPALIPTAIDEFMRRFPLVCMGRVVARDIPDYEGVEMKAGDMVIIPTMLHGLDERENERPMEIDIHRARRDYSTFGQGPHRCVGAHLARLEARVTLEEWLARIPDFAVEAGAEISYRPGIVGVVNALPLVWDAASVRRTGELAQPVPA